MKGSGASQRDRINAHVDKQLRAWASWLAEDDGVPVAVQPCFEMTSYEDQAAEIVERIK